MLKQYLPIQRRAMKKLGPGESSALLGPLIASVSVAASQTEDEDTGRYLHLVEKTYREFLDRLNQPLYFLGPNGERWTEEEWNAYVYDQLTD